MSQRWRRANIPLTGPGSSKTVPIVGDAAIATAILGEGRLIPVLIIDTSDRPDIGDLVKILQRPPLGDVTSQWGRLHWHKKTVALILTFKRPSTHEATAGGDGYRQGEFGLKSAAYG